MNDWARGGTWTVFLVCGVASVILLHQAGLSRTYARDLLHVGAGTWVLGWPGWTEATVPLILAGTVFVATMLVPLLSSRLPSLRRLHDSVAGEGERWAGIVAYAGSFAALTALALVAHLLPAAACAATALAAGDGLGGLIGRRFGRHRYALPWSKAKSWEGTAAVALFSAAGMALVLQVLHVPVDWRTVLLLGTVSAAAEALAPRASDNVLVPAAVFGAAVLLGEPF